MYPFIWFYIDTSVAIYNGTIQYMQNARIVSYLFPSLIRTVHM